MVKSVILWTILVDNYCDLTLELYSITSITENFAQVLVKPLFNIFTLWLVLATSTLRYISDISSRWHSCARAILHCWRPICTVSDAETPPLVHIAMVLTRWQNIWCYTAQHTTRRGGSHGQISTIKATQDAYGASWRGSGWYPSPRPGMRDREVYLYLCNGCKYH